MNTYPHSQTWLHVNKRTHKLSKKAEKATALQPLENRCNSVGFLRYLFLKRQIMKR